MRLLKPTWVAHDGECIVRGPPQITTLIAGGRLSPAPQAVHANTCYHDDEMMYFTCFFRQYFPQCPTAVEYVPQHSDFGVISGLTYRSVLIPGSSIC